MSIPSAPVNPGDVLAGKYRVERLLGMGNMGVVVTATHLGLGQRVALKFLLAHRAGHQALHERFLREARAAACLKSQHVTRVSDVGTLENGAPYMVMELLDGADLAAVLDQHGKLPIADAVEYILQVCDAVAEAHRAGIVHRDLKPANLFLTKHADGSPCVKVMDFGVSKVASADNLKLTAEGQAVGSPLYMSPEQMMAKADVDARSDIWALGVILYELVAGKTPFHAETMLALHTNVLAKPPTPLSTYLSEAPRGFEEVILRCLDKQADRRWANVADFAAALVPYAPQRAAQYAARVASVLGVTIEPSRPTEVLTLEAAKLRASEPVVNMPALGVVGTTTGATSQPAVVPPKGGKGWIAGTVSAMVVAGLLGGFAVVRARGSTASTTSAGAPGASSEPLPMVTATAAPSADRPSPPASEVPSAAPAPESTAAATATNSASTAPAPSPTPRGGSPPRTAVAPKALAPTRPAAPSGNLYDRGDKR